MKKYLFILLPLLFSCNNEQQNMCNCEVTGNDQVRTVRNIDGIQLIQSSHPADIFPYDTIVDCSQDQLQWTDVRVVPVLDGQSTITSFRKINCN